MVNHITNKYLKTPVFDLTTTGKGTAFVSCIWEGAKKTGVGIVQIDNVFYVYCLVDDEGVFSASDLKNNLKDCLKLGILVPEQEGYIEIMSFGQGENFSEDAAEYLNDKGYLTEEDWEGIDTLVADIEKTYSVEEMV